MMDIFADFERVFAYYGDLAHGPVLWIVPDVRMCWRGARSDL